MKQIDQFKNFVKCNICKGMFGDKIKIHNIVLCYKLKKLIKLQEELEILKKKKLKLKMIQSKLKRMKN